MRMSVILTVNRAGTLTEDVIGHEYITGRSVREMQAVIESWACRKFGRAQKGDWRMRADAGALVPCYAVEMASGDTISLR